MHVKKKLNYRKIKNYIKKDSTLTKWKTTMIIVKFLMEMYLIILFQNIMKQTPIKKIICVFN